MEGREEVQQAIDDYKRAQYSRILCKRLACTLFGQRCSERNPFNLLFLLERKGKNKIAAEVLCYTIQIDRWVLEGLSVGHFENKKNRQRDGVMAVFWPCPDLCTLFPVSCCVPHLKLGSHSPVYVTFIFFCLAAAPPSAQ